jgi:tripartite-type tricarboxylate transporter receptor subunit TctC
MKRREFLGAAGLYGLACVAARAQEAPTPKHLPRELRLIVPSPTGGAPDLVARTLGEFLGRVGGLSVSVLNVDGANGELALARFLREEADGRTWLLAQDSVIVVNPSFYPRAQADILHGLAPVAQVGASSFMLLVKDDDPIRSIDELLQAARSADPPLLYGSGGVGSQGHLLMEDLAARLGLRLNHVPYRGNSPAAAGLVRGEVRLLMAGVSSLGLVRAGRLRVIAVATPRRSPMFPDVPALSEVLPGFYGTAWFGLFGRGGTPADALAEMLQFTETAVASAEMRAALLQRGNVAASFSSGAAFRTLIDDERRRFAAIAARLPADK